MATQATPFSTTFTPSKSGNGVVSLWKQLPASYFITPKPLKFFSGARTLKSLSLRRRRSSGFHPSRARPQHPTFGGSTGGLLCKAQVEEFYVSTWESSKEQIFEMPTGGAAITRQGPNLLKLALGTRLRIYRVFPNGEVQYLHPKDGVYPEKVNPGREGVGLNFKSIRKNVSPIEVKLTGKQVYEL